MVDRFEDQTVVRVVSESGREVGSIAGSETGAPFTRVEMEIEGRSLTLQLEDDSLEVFLDADRAIHLSVAADGQAELLEQIDGCPEELIDRLPALGAVLDDPVLRSILEGLEGFGELDLRVQLLAAGGKCGAIGRECTTVADCSKYCWCDNPSGDIGGGTCKQNPPRPALVDSVEIY